MVSITHDPLKAGQAAPRCLSGLACLHQAMIDAFQ